MNGPYKVEKFVFDNTEIGIAHFHSESGGVILLGQNCGYLAMQLKKYYDDMDPEIFESLLGKIKDLDLVVDEYQEGLCLTGWNSILLNRPISLLIKEIGESSLFEKLGKLTDEVRDSAMNMAFVFGDTVMTIEFDKHDFQTSHKVVVLNSKVQMRGLLMESAPVKCREALLELLNTCATIPEISDNAPQIIEGAIPFFLACAMINAERSVVADRPSFIPEVKPWAKNYRNN